MNLLHKYANGNFTVSIFDDGTKIRENDKDFFKADFPENIDLKISDRCNMGCSFCHENSTKDGQIITHINYNFLDTLRAGTELAIGGGNIFEVDVLPILLVFCKLQGVIANITVNQMHFLENKHKIINWMKDHLVYGVGVSYDGNSKMLNMMMENVNKKNIVIHVINGIHSLESIMALANQGYKLLILGYKNLRRGVQYKDIHQKEIDNNQKNLNQNIGDLIKYFEVVSFDNLALEQLNIKGHMSQEKWNEFYMGDDGQFTMYIDLVKEEFAKNSTSIERFRLKDTIDEMFTIL